MRTELTHEQARIRLHEALHADLYSSIARDADFAVLDSLIETEVTERMQQLAQKQLFLVENADINAGEYRFSSHYVFSYMRTPSLLCHVAVTKGSIRFVLLNVYRVIQE